MPLNPIRWDNIGAPQFNNSGYGVAGAAFGEASEGAARFAKSMRDQEEAKQKAIKEAITNSSIRRALQNGTIGSEDYQGVPEGTDMTTYLETIGNYGTTQSGIKVDTARIAESKAITDFNIAEQSYLPERESRAATKHTQDITESNARIATQGAVQAANEADREFTTLQIGATQEGIVSEKRIVKGLETINQRLHGNHAPVKDTQGNIITPGSFYWEGREKFNKTEIFKIFGEMLPRPLPLMSPTELEEFHRSIPPADLEKAADEYAKTYVAQKRADPETLALLADEANLSVIEASERSKYGRDVALDDAAFREAASTIQTQKEEERLIRTTSRKAFVEGDNSTLLYNGTDANYGVKNNISIENAKAAAYKGLDAPENDDLVKYARSLFPNVGAFKSAFQKTIIPKGDGWFDDTEYVEKPYELLDNLHSSLKAKASEPDPTAFNSSGDPYVDAKAFLKAGASGGTSNTDTPYQAGATILGETLNKQIESGTADSKEIRSKLEPAAAEKTIKKNITNLDTTLKELVERIKTSTPPSVGKFTTQNDQLQEYLRAFTDRKSQARTVGGREPSNIPSKEYTVEDLQIKVSEFEALWASILASDVEAEELRNRFKKSEADNLLIQALAKKP